jgi:C1A family cysteine protease
MSPTRYPSAAQEQEVAANSAALARAYRAFKEPRRSSKRRRPRAPAESLAPASAAALAAAGSSFDWRDKIAISPPGDQKLCYACTGFAIAASIEARQLIAHPGQPIAVSAGFIHTCIGHADDSDAGKICNLGCDMYAVLGALESNAYAQLSPGDYPFASAACPAAQRLTTIQSFDPIVDRTTATNNLVSAGPLAADMYIWEDFFSYTTTRSPTYTPDSTTAGPYLHSVCVVGFEPTGWIVKNSMGTSWGDGTGFATIAYGACGLIGEPAPPGKSPREAYAVTV